MDVAVRLFPALIAQTTVIGSVFGLLLAFGLYTLAPDSPPLAYAGVVLIPMLAGCIVSFRTRQC